jgi:hypothetical protein
MKFAKILCSCLLGSAVLLLVAPEASAQRVLVGTYSGTYSHAPRPYVTYASSRVWIPGGYETIRQQIWVPGCSERIWVEPIFEWRSGPCHTQIRIQLGGGYWRTVHHAGHYEYQPVSVYRPGHWTARGFCD